MFLLQEGDRVAVGGEDGVGASAFIACYSNDIVARAGDLGECSQGDEAEVDAEGVVEACAWVLRYEGDATGGDVEVVGGSVGRCKR